MGKTIKVAVPLGAILLLLAVPAFADSLSYRPEKMYWFAGSLPGSLFQQGYGISFVQDIPEADLGPPTPNCTFPAIEITVCTLPEAVIPGDVVLLEDISLGQDPSNWSDVLRFGEPPFAELTTLATLYSDGWGDFSTWQLAPLFVFIQETVPPTVYIAPPNTYYIWSDAPEHLVPEPSTLLLLGTTLVSLFSFKRRPPKLRGSAVVA